MKTYKYLSETTVAVFDEDGISRMSGLVSIVPDGEVIEPADVPPAPTYQELRAAAYPPITDYLDGIVKGDVEQVAAYVAACLAVKALFPKE